MFRRGIAILSLGLPLAVAAGTLDSTCPTDPWRSYEAIRRETPAGVWEVSYFVWLRGEGKAHLALQHDGGDAPYDWVEGAKRKAAFIEATIERGANSKTPNAIYQSTLEAYFFLRSLSDGFKPIRNWNLAASMEPIACDFARTFFISKVKASPLALAENDRELEKMVSLLKNRSAERAQEFNRWSNTTKDIWPILRDEFQANVRRRYQWYRFLVEMITTPPDYSETNPTLFGEFVRDEIRMARWVLGYPNVPTAEETPTTPIEIDRDQRFAWLHLLGREFTRYRFRQNKQIRDIEGPLEALIESDFGGAIERPITRHAEIKFGNREYEVPMSAMISLESPSLFSHLLRMAEFDIRLFPKKVRQTMEQEPADSKIGWLDDWLFPKKTAIEVLTNNMAAYSEAELNSIVAWTYAQLQELTANCIGNCAAGTYLKRRVDEYTERYNILFAEAHAIRVRRTTDPTEYTLPRIDGLQRTATDVARELRVNGRRTMVQRFAWTILDHPFATTAFFLTPYLLPAGATVTIIRGLVSLSAFTASVQLGRVVLGQYAPENRWTLSGAAAGHAQVYAEDQLLLVIAPYVLWKGGAAFMREIRFARDLLPAYEKLGLQPGATPREIRSAWLALSKQIHPDIGGTEAEMAAINAAYAQLEKAFRAPLSRGPRLAEVFLKLQRSIGSHDVP